MATFRYSRQWHWPMAAKNGQPQVVSPRSQCQHRCQADTLPTHPSRLCKHSGVCTNVLYWKSTSPPCCLLSSCGDSSSSHGNFPVVLFPGGNKTSHEWPAGSPRLFLSVTSLPLLSTVSSHGPVLKRAASRRCSSSVDMLGCKKLVLSKDVTVLGC